MKRSLQILNDSSFKEFENFMFMPIFYSIQYGRNQLIVWEPPIITDDRWQNTLQARPRGSHTSAFTQLVFQCFYSGTAMRILLTIATWYGVPQLPVLDEQIPSATLSQTHSSTAYVEPNTLLVYGWVVDLIGGGGLLDLGRQTVVCLQE